MEIHMSYKHNTKLCKKEAKIKNLIMNDCKTDFGPDYKMLKNDEQFVIDACNLIEQCVGKTKINKKQLCLNTLHDLFGLNDEELLRIGSLIDVLHSNGCIKKYKRSVYVYKMLKQFVVRFFLVK